MPRRAFGNQRGEVIPGATLRTDAWWLLPAVVVLVLGAFIVYSTWAAFQNAHYFAAPYLSPFYSPCISKSWPMKISVPKRSAGSRSRIFRPSSSTTATAAISTRTA